MIIKIILTVPTAETYRVLPKRILKFTDFKHFNLKVSNYIIICEI